MWVGKSKIKVYECFAMEKFINVTQSVNEWLKFFDYVLYEHVVFEVFL